MPTAEQNGFIVELGRWVLKSAIRHKKRWEEKGIDIKLAINIAAKQIQQEGFIEHLQNLLEEHQVNHSNITFEITEYIFLNSNQNLHKTFTAIKELGIEVSLDDFGTGYSSLSYLKAFPVDTLKIDKAFIDDYSSEEGLIFIETIIKMAQTLQIKVVAEGVETVEQLSYLKALNCDLFQGYLCSKPTTVQEFEILYTKQIPSVELSQQALEI